MLSTLTSLIVNNLEKDESGKVKKTPLVMMLIFVLAIGGVAYMEYESSMVFKELQGGLVDIGHKQAKLIGIMTTLTDLKTGSFETISKFAESASNTEQILGEISDIRDVDIRKVMGMIHDLNINQLSDDVSDIRNVELKRLMDVIREIQTEIAVLSRTVSVK